MIRVGLRDGSLLFLAGIKFGVDAWMDLAVERCVLATTNVASWPRSIMEANEV